MGNPYDGYGGSSAHPQRNPLHRHRFRLRCVQRRHDRRRATATADELLFNPTPLLGLNVSRRVYVPTDDHFERTLNVFNNPTGSAHHGHDVDGELPGLGRHDRRDRHLGGWDDRGGCATNG